MNTVIMMNYIKILERTNVSDICISFVRGCFVVYKHSVVQLKALFPHLLIYIFHTSFHTKPLRNLARKDINYPN